MGFVAEADEINAAAELLANVNRESSAVTGAVQTIITAMANFNAHAASPIVVDAPDAAVFPARRTAIVAACKAKIVNIADATFRTQVRNFLTAIAQP